MIKRLPTILMAVLLIGASAQAAIPMQCGSIVAMDSHYLSQLGGKSRPTPCNGMPPGWLYMSSCAVFVSLPVRAEDVSQKIVWASIVCFASVSNHNGFSIEPDIGPSNAFRPGSAPGALMDPAENVHRAMPYRDGIRGIYPMAVHWTTAPL